MRRARTWFVAWAVLIGVPLAVELVTISNTTAGDTLSEQVIPWLQTHPFIWASTIGLWVGMVGWLTWHWWFQYLRPARRRASLADALDAKTKELFGLYSYRHLTANEKHKVLQAIYYESSDFPPPPTEQ